MVQTVKKLPAMWETWIRSLDWEDTLQKGMVTQYSILPWRIPWIEEPGELQFMGLQRVGHGWLTHTHTLTQESTSVPVLSLKTLSLILKTSCKVGAIILGLQMRKTGLRKETWLGHALQLVSEVCRELKAGLISKALPSSAVAALPHDLW